MKDKNSKKLLTLKVNKKPDHKHNQVYYDFLDDQLVITRNITFAVACDEDETGLYFRYFDRYSEFSFYIGEL